MSTLRTVSFLAIKDLNKDRRIAALVICVIAFSFVNITVSSAFINGLGNTFKDAIVNTATSHIYISPSEGTNAKYVNSVSLLRKKIELNPDVIASTPRIDLAATIRHGTNEMSVRTLGIVPSDEQMVSTLHTYITDGSFLTDGADSEIILGRFVAGERAEDVIGQETFGALSEGIKATVGDVVTVRYPNGIEKTYRVRGIVTSYGVGSVALQAYITYDEAKRVMSLGDQASSVLVRIRDRDNAEAVKKQLLQQGVSNVEVRTWIEASSFVSAITSTFDIVGITSTLVGIIVVVVTIGIVVFINTARKKRIIGVLKAVGMSSNQIMYIFLFQSVVLGALGTMLGLGMFLAASVSTQSTPIALPIGELSLSLPAQSLYWVVFTIMISSLIAGYIPAKLASRQKILDTIKTVD